METEQKICPCRLKPVATEQEHPEAHKANRCVPCWENEMMFNILRVSYLAREAKEKAEQEDSTR